MNWPRRLLEDENSDPTLERAQSLMASVQLQPASQIEQRRVYRALAARRHKTMKRALWRRSLAIVGVLAFGTSAAATVVGRYAERFGDERQGPPPLERTKRVTPMSDTTVAPRHSPMAPTVPVNTTVSQKPKVERRLVPRPTSLANNVTSTSTASPVAIIVEATQALRVQHAPTRALTLLQRYLKTDRAGTLREEAYGLALEASSSQGKESRSAWARAYMKEFPRGRFTLQAQRLLALP